MPFAGPKNLGEDAVAYYFQQRNLKEQRGIRKREFDATQALAKQESARRDMELSLQEDRAARGNAESEQRMSMDRAQEGRNVQASTEHADALKAKLESLDAETKFYVGKAYRIAQETPELAPDIQTHSRIMGGLAGKSPEARATYAGLAVEDLDKKKQVIDTAKFNHLEAAALGGMYGSVDGAADPRMTKFIETLKQTGPDGKLIIPPGEAVKAIQARHKELSNLDAEVQYRTANSPLLLQTYIGMAKTPEQKYGIQQVAARFARTGGPTETQAAKEMQEIVTPETVSPNTGAQLLDHLRGTAANTFAGKPQYQIKDADGNVTGTDFAKIARDVETLHPDKAAEAARAKEYSDSGQRAYVDRFKSEGMTGGKSLGKSSGDDTMAKALEIKAQVEAAGGTKEDYIKALDAAGIKHK